MGRASSFPSQHSKSLMSSKQLEEAKAKPFNGSKSARIIFPLKKQITFFIRGHKRK